MGRELKRVPLDFDWPMQKTWPGFQNPWYKYTEDSKTANTMYEAWQEVPPPTGEGWQLWETVSDGSPISPVFPTKEAFIEYLVSEGYSRGAATAFCEDGWAPSAVFVGGKFYNDIEGADKE